VLTGSSRSQYQSIYLDLLGRKILKWIFKKWDGKTWNGLFWLRIETGVSACECGNKPSSHIKYGDLLASHGPGSSVGIATDYGLDGPGIESWWGRDFSHMSRAALGPTQPPEQWVPGLSRG
jgi:hypothetical protein